jgi:hypothetical protein
MNNNSLVLCPIGDEHIGSKYFNEDALKKNIDWCLEEGAYVILMGDELETATKTSVGAGVFEQSEIVEGQLEKTVKLYKPLADEKRILGNLVGNHEMRVFNHSGANLSKILSQLLDANIKMKSTNEGLRQSYNMAMFVKPYQYEEKYKVDLVPLFPWQYSVVEQTDNRQISICHILSEYKIKNKGPGYVQQENPRLSIDSMNRSTSPGDPNNWYQKVKYGDGKDQTIADNFYDQDSNQPFYFWSKKYHFICNVKGEILSKDTLEVVANPQLEDLLNPIQEKTIIDFSINSHNCY